MLNEKIRVEDLLKNYPLAADFLENLGFKGINNDKSPFRKLTLSGLAQIKKTGGELLVKQLVEYLENSSNRADVTLKWNDKQKLQQLSLKGVLPCPVRIPLLELLNNVIEEHQIEIDLNLLSASAGVSWMSEEIDFDDLSTIPSISISAGFEFFFSEKSKEIMKKGFYTDIMEKKVNATFNKFKLKDPYQAVSVLGVVPAIFMVNLSALGERKIPESWAELLSEEFSNDVSVPVGDFDLFNSMVLHLYHRFGEDGIKYLAKTMAWSAHPSQSIKGQKHSAQKQPAVTIMPYFFSRMAFRMQNVKIVWPQDGAIISPIYALVRKDQLEKIKPIVDVLASPKMGEILAHGGLFPSTHPQIDNKLPSDYDFQWIGWDYVFSNPIEKQINQLIEKFKGYMEE